MNPPVYCARCGSRAQLGMRFCPGCGAPAVFPVMAEPRKRRPWLIPLVVGCAVVVVAAVVSAMAVVRFWAPYNHAATVLSDQPPITDSPEHRWVLDEKAFPDGLQGLVVLGTSKDESVILIGLYASGFEGIAGVLRDSGELAWLERGVGESCTVPGRGQAFAFGLSGQQGGRGDLVACAAGSAVVYRDVKTGEPRKTFTSGVGQIGQLLVGHVDSTLVEVVLGGTGPRRALEVIGRDPANLRERWRHETTDVDPEGHLVLASVVGSEVVVSTGDSLLAYDADSGDSSARFPQAALVVALPDGTYVTYEGADGGTARIHGEGALRDVPVPAIVSLAAFDRVPSLHLACTDRSCAVASATTPTGEVRWAAAASDNLAGLFCGNRYILIEGSDRTGYSLIAHRSDNGQEAWRVPAYFGGGAGFPSCRRDQLLAHDGTSLVAYDARTGHRQWEVSGTDSAYVTHLRGGMLILDTVGENGRIAYYS